MAEAQSTILIVDDDAEDLASVERALRSLGSELVTVKDPHEVLPSVHREHPDVVILDALLPGLSGFDLCKQIKTDPQLKGTQVLILTGVYLRQQYRQEALQQFKADAFLTKPFRPPELQRIVVRLLARRTRTPSSTFLKRMGLPVSRESGKKSLFGRLFARGGAREDAEAARIAPAARDSAPAPPLALAEADAPGEPAEMTANEAPPAPMPQPDGTPAEPKPMPEPDPAEAAPLPPELASETAEPTADKTPEETKSPEEPAPAPPPLAEATTPPEESSAGEAAEGSSDEPDAVILVETDSRAQDLSLDEVAARIAGEGASRFEEPVSSENPAPQLVGETPAAADSGVPIRKPRLRVGDVPIYDESDFLSELKRELSKCKRVDRPLTLILIRVGDLSQIVELFGKDFREPVLWHIAEQAMVALREVDLVGMMSSKELIAMTAFASDRYGGGRIVSRMRQAVSRKPFRIGEELPPIIPVLDFGMATFPADGSEAVSLLRRAEQDLFDGQRSAASN